MPGVANANCPVKLKPGYKAEPLILRGNAGDCVTLTVYNRLPVKAPDLPTLATLHGRRQARPQPAGGLDPVRQQPDPCLEPRRPSARSWLRSIRSWTWASTSART